MRDIIYGRPLSYCCPKTGLQKYYSSATLPPNYNLIIYIIWYIIIDLLGMLNRWITNVIMVLLLCLLSAKKMSNFYVAALEKDWESLYFFFESNPFNRPWSRSTLNKVELKMGKHIFLSSFANCLNLTYLLHLQCERR